MFYGNIHPTGAPLPGTAHSNNFTATRVNDAVQIVLHQWTEYAPVFTVTNSPQPSNDDLDFRSGYTIERQDGNNQFSPWVVTVKTYNAGGSLASRAISFRGSAGMNRAFMVDDLRVENTLVMSPKIVDFKTGRENEVRKILVLSTNVPGGGVYLDQGTVLTAIGTSMKLELDRDSVLDCEGQEWTLSGWTYDVDSVQGQKWKVKDGKPYFQMTTNPTDYGPGTTYGSFSIMGKTLEGSYIVSDPVVRLASVAPGGVPVRQASDSIG